jgi:hypothetical protein
MHLILHASVGPSRKSNAGWNPALLFLPAACLLKWLNGAHLPGARGACLAGSAAMAAVPTIRKVGTPAPWTGAQR